MTEVVANARLDGKGRPVMMTLTNVRPRMGCVNIAALIIQGLTGAFATADSFSSAMDDANEMNAFASKTASTVCAVMVSAFADRDGRALDAVQM